MNGTCHDMVDTMKKHKHLPVHEKCDEQYLVNYRCSACRRLGTWNAATNEIFGTAVTVDGGACPIGTIGEDKVECECGQTFGEKCCWAGPTSLTVELCWMPEYLRDNHLKAENKGVWGQNGALRLRVNETCARRLKDADPEWTELL